MRRLRFLQQGRTAILSAGAHGVLLAVLLIVSARSGGGVSLARAPIIVAELVTLRAPAPGVAPQVGDTTPVPLPPAPPTEAPAPAPEESVVPAPAAAPPVASLAETPDEPEPEPEPEPAPVAPLANPVTEIEQVIAAAGSATEAAAPAPTATTATEPSAQRPLDAPQQQMLSRRLASWTGRFTASEPMPTMAWREDGQEYTAVLRPVPAASVMGMEQLAVEVTTERDGERLVTEMRLTRVAFSNFAQFVDRWDPDVQLHDDVIDGRFHSNSNIRVSRERGVRPTFRGKVTLAARDIITDNVGWLNRRTLFPAGLETGVRRIMLPAQAVSFTAHTIASEALQRFERDTTITFHADGSYAWQPAEGGTEQRRTLGDEPHYLVGAERVVLHVRGTVNGTALVYTPERIVIDDDLRYADDPRQPGATDYLGLVAERTVEIAEPEVTGLGDLEVQASIYGRRQFVVRSFRSRPSGTLRIYGSLAAGSLTATEPRFATQIEFDPRLTTVRAPGFPQSDRYELESWNGAWRRAQ